MNKQSGECRNCQWWTPPQPSEIGDWGECQMAEADYHDEDSLAPGPAHLETKAVAYDCEYYHAGLYTKPDFGCNQWAARLEEIIHADGVCNQRAFYTVGRLIYGAALDSTTVRLDKGGPPTDGEPVCCGSCGAAIDPSLLRYRDELGTT